MDFRGRPSRGSVWATSFAVLPVCQDVAAFRMVVDTMQSSWWGCGLSACGDVDQCVGDTLQLAGSSDDISFTDGCEAFTYTAWWEWVLFAELSRWHLLVECGWHRL